MANMQDTNKAPKVILNGEFKYVRSDLVDGLVEALKSMVYEMEDYSGWKQFSVCKDARAALKALEEE